MKHYKRSRLTIPEHIAATLPIELLERLKLDGHGISFNSLISIQMRYIYYGADLGGSYLFSRYGSWKAAINAAIDEHDKLAVQYPNLGHGCSPHKGVFFRTRKRKDSETLVYNWVVNFYDNQKAKVTHFYCGNENTITPERKNHAELTAWHFRRLYCETLDPNVLSRENCKGWQTKQYYD